jgi:hypothetical protein
MWALDVSATRFGSVRRNLSLWRFSLLVILGLWVDSINQGDVGKEH